MHRTLVVVLLVFALGCAGAPAPRFDLLEPLAFVLGEWRAGDEQGQCTEERWVRSSSGALEGSARTIASGAVVHTEIIRIEARDGAVVYVASPAGQERTEFTLVDCADGRALFENLAHDFPQRITYEREGDALVARIEDRAGERGATWNFRPGRCE